MPAVCGQLGLKGIVFCPCLTSLFLLCVCVCVCVCCRLRSSCVLWRSRERFTRSAWSWSRTVRNSRRRSRKSSSARASPGPSSPSPWRPPNETAPPSSTCRTLPSSSSSPIQLSLLIIRPHASSSSSVERSLRFGSAEGRPRRGRQPGVLTRPRGGPCCCSRPWRGGSSSPRKDLTAPSILPRPLPSSTHRTDDSCLCRFCFFLSPFLFTFLGNLNFWRRLL